MTIDLVKEHCDVDECDRELLIAEIERLRAQVKALEEELAFRWAAYEEAVRG